MATMAHIRKAVRTCGLFPALLAALFVLSACGPAVKNPNFKGEAVPQLPPVDQEYRIHVGDKLSVKHFYNPDLSQDVVVRPDGKISLQLVHEVMAAGLTPAELSDTLIKKYGEHLEQPEITVVLNTFAGHRIFVGGEVGQSGARDLVGPTTVLQAVTMSGGFKETARTTEVIVMRRDANYKPFTIIVNMEVVMDGSNMSQDIVLQPYDMVLVPKSNIANVNAWLEQYIRRPIAIPREFLFYYQFYHDVFQNNNNSNNVF